MAESNNDIRKTMKITKSSQCRWISMGETVEVQGILLTKGGFYLGDYFKAPQNLPSNIQQVSRSKTIFGPVINPSLKAEEDIFNGEDLNSYYDLSPASRFKYLMWLGGKINTEDLPNYLIKLYVYGIQIRLFLDLETSNSEREVLINTLIDIKNLFSANPLVYPYVGTIIDNALAMFFMGDIQKFNTENINLAMYTKAAVAKSIIKISKGDINAIYGVFTNSFAYRTIPEYFIKNVKENFSSYFKNFNAPLYWYCESDIDFDFPIEEEKNVDNVRYKIIVESCRYTISNAVWELEKQFHRITEDFYDYNKVAKIVETPLAPLAYFSLPSYIKERNQQIEVNLKSQIDRIISGNQGVTTIDDILHLLGVSAQSENKTIPKNILDLSLSGLNRIGYDIIPNYQLGQPRVNYGDNCIIFKMKKAPLIIASDKDTLLKLLVLVLQVDLITEDDFDFVTNLIVEIESDKDQQNYLKAYFKWLTLKKSVINKKTKEEYSNLDTAQKNQYVKFLLLATYAKGSLNEKRASALQKVLVSLGINDNIHALLQRVMTDPDGFAFSQEKDPNDKTLVSSALNKEAAETSPTVIENLIIAITKNGYIQKVRSRSFSVQKLGYPGSLYGCFSAGLKALKEVSSRDKLLLFTENGMCYQIHIDEIPFAEGQDCGLSLNEKFSAENEVFCSILSINNSIIDNDDKYSVLIMTKYGQMTRHKVSDYKRSKAFKAIAADKEDFVVSVSLAKNTDCIFNCSNVGFGKSFDIEEVRSTALQSKGVKCYNFSPNSKHYDPAAALIGFDVNDNDISSFIVVTKQGYICRTFSFTIGRSTTGMRIIKLRENDTVVGNLFVTESDQILIVTKKGYTARLAINSIKETKCGRNGSLSIKLEADDEVISCCKMSSINDAQLSSDEFATIEKTTDAVEYNIPKPTESSKQASVKFDDDKLKNIEKQTAEVQGMLSKIFDEEETSTAIQKPSNDNLIKDILEKLFEKEAWTLAELDKICKEKGQMVNYVLESINDYSYEIVGDAVLEQDNDMIYVTMEYKDSLL